ncbi:MAG: hypothetical protein H0X45_12470, partial [Planctomycetes bacterium]|nr:hypothetical protein [Planctomycetota bacterium]
MTFVPTQSATYETVIVTRSVTLVAGARITPALRGATILARRWDEGSVVTQADIEETVTDPTRAGTQVAGHFTSPDLGRTLIAGAQTVQIEFHPYDQSTYTGAVFLADLTVFRRSQPPLWIGSPALPPATAPATARSLNATVTTAGAQLQLPAVQLTWTASTSSALSQDVLRLAEADHQPIQPIASEMPFLLLNAGIDDVFPYSPEVVGTPRIARAPQWVTVAQLPAAANRFTDVDVRNSWMDPMRQLVRQRYIYRIRTLDAAGRSSCSEPVTAAMRFERPLSVAPTGLTVAKRQSDGAERFALTWNAPADTSGVAAYDIYLASAVEANADADNRVSYPLVPIDLIRHGLVEARHRWIRVGSTRDTSFTWVDDGHPDLLWSTIPHFHNPEWPTLAQSTFVDPWTVEHCQPSYLFKVVAVGSSGRQLVAEQASGTVVIDGDRSALMRPRFTNRLNLAQARPTGAGPEWAYQDAHVAADANGQVSISWASLAYDFSLPRHLANGPYAGLRDFMDWGAHRATILCDGAEIGTASFNIRVANRTRVFAHRPGAGAHVYQVRITNYRGLTCISGEMPIVVGGATSIVVPTDLEPYNLAVDRSNPAAWRVAWSPSQPPVTGSVFVTMLDGQEATSGTQASAELAGVVANVPHRIQVVLRSATGEALGQSLAYDVPAARPETGAQPPAAPPAPTLKAVERASVTLAWSPVVASDVIGFDLARDGKAIARVAPRAEFTDDMTTAASARGYRLRAVTRDDRKSEWGPERRVQPAPDDTAPGMPTAVTTTDADGGGVRVSWVGDPASEDVVSFLIYRDGAYLGTSSASPYLDLTINDDLLHRYTVVAVDRAGNASQA